MRLDKLISVKFRDWEFSVDKELNEAISSSFTASPDVCSCAACKNFVENRETVYPQEIKDFLASIGVDYKQEAEIFHSHTNSDGTQWYGGWFHAKGYFTGKNCAIPIIGGNGVHVDLTPITEKFKIGFTSDNALHNFEDGHDLIQIEIMVEVPWTIEKEFEPQYQI